MFPWGTSSSRAAVDGNRRMEEPVTAALFDKTGLWEGAKAFERWGQILSYSSI